MKEYMDLAYKQACRAFDEGEVPVGAVIVRDGEVIAKAHNLTKTLHDTTMHAEMIALNEASTYLDTDNLSGCELYVTMEPCPMCMGAVILSKISKLVYGCNDTEFGACGGYINLASHPSAKRLEVYGGIDEDKCASLLKLFFLELRKQKKSD